MRCYPKQQGFALLIMLLSLMTVGGLIASKILQNMTREVKQSRVDFDRKVLKEAKAALLQYAYQYPSINNKGPGRMPCTDADNDGDSDVTFGTCNSLGRYPWANPDLNTRELLDSSGERLWYVVSSNFATNVSGGNNINFDTLGTITIIDQAGEIKYDGAVDGVAAVIIAPSSAIDRNGTLQDRIPINSDDRFDTVADTDPAIINAINYLDISGTSDNASYVEGDLALVTSGNGFILGPIESVNNTILINDMIEVVTTQEIAEIAEKSVLQTYRDAILTYQENIWGATTANYRYPWLDSYSNLTDLTDHDATVQADANPVIGRVPSIFANYFDVSDAASETFSSALDMNMTFSVGITSPTQFTENFNDSSISNMSFNVDGDLATNSTYSNTIVKYYWDGNLTTPGINSPADGVWEECTGSLLAENACNRKADGTFKVTGDVNEADSDVWLRVTKVTIVFNSSASSIAYAIGNKIGVTLNYVAPTSADHAYVYQDYSNNGLYAFSATYDDDYLATFDETSYVVTADNISIGVRYYPEIPVWALDNNWHDSVMLASVNTFKPGSVSTDCIVPVECINVLNMGGVSNDKQALLVMAAESGFIDEAIDGYGNDLGDIFDAENDDESSDSESLNFDLRASNGNDRILVFPNL